MSLKATEIRPTTSEEWDHAWGSCAYATHFHSRDWAETWATYTQGVCQPAALTVRFSDGKSAVWPLTRERRYKGLTQRYLSSPAGTYGGWISEDDLAVEHGQLLLAYYERKLKNSVWRLNPYDPVACQLRLPARVADETQTLQLGGGIDGLFRNWTKGHKSAVSKARREGVFIRLAQEERDWLEYFSVYEDSLRRWGDTASSRYEVGLFKEFARRKSPSVKLWLAVHQGRVIAGGICLYAPRHVVYWHGAALESHFLLRPVHLLVYEAIKHACEGGAAWFDFNPSGGHEGVAAFKRSFGTIPLPCGLVRRVGRIECLANTLRRLGHRQNQAHLHAPSLA